MKNLNLFLIIIFVPILFLNSCDKAEEIETKSEQFNISELTENLKIMPHESIDEKEFARQYKANKVLWDKSFEFLKTIDLNNVSPGRYIIDEGNSTAYVSVGSPSELEDISWETHDNFIDLQYIARGKVQMGIAPRESGIIAEEYDSDKDVTIYGQVHGEFYETDPSSFFLFFPSDIHRPAIKIEGHDEIKKILLKIRASPSKT